MNIRRINIWPPSSSSSGSCLKPTGLLPSLPIPANSAATAIACCTVAKPIDLVYNRLTDFSLDAAVNADLRAIFDADGVVVTPHPRAHALYADKRNLMLLSDEAALIEIGVPEATRKILLAGIPRTVAVKAEEGERFWAERKRWFFKIATGFGSRAAYRGDKLTKRVFEEILQGGYIAQEIVPPSEHSVVVEANRN
jgi:hypothetical protein